MIPLALCFFLLLLCPFDVRADDNDSIDSPDCPELYWECKGDTVTFKPPEVKNRSSAKTLYFFTNQK